MGNDAIKAIRMILDNSDYTIKNIQTEVFKILNLGNYTPLNEYIKDSLEHFSFNISEKRFFEQVKNAIIEELGKEIVDYNVFADNIILSLKKIKEVNNTFDDDFRELAININNKFPMIASNDWYSRLSSKKEEIISIINKYNQNIIETLIKLTPQFASELSALENKAKSNTNTSIQQNSNNDGIKNSDVKGNVINSKSAKETIIEMLQKQLTELNIHWKKLQKYSVEDGYDRSKIAKCIRNLNSIILQIQGSNFNDSMPIDQINNYYKKIISEKAPELSEILQILEKHNNRISILDNEIYAFVNSTHLKITQSNDVNQLLNIKNEIESMINKYGKNKQIKEQLELELMNVINKIVSLTDSISQRTDNPNAPNPLTANSEIGNTNESMLQLIDSGNYFSVLQGITNNNINKYRNFINNGFRVIYNRWLVNAQQARNNEQRMQSFEQLKEIYNQFKDYMQSEKDTLKTLESTILEMNNYFANLQLEANEQLMQDSATRSNRKGGEIRASSIRR